MPDRAATPLVDERPARVLVVDDEAGLAVALGDVFRTAGWQAEVAHTGADAVAVAGRLRPDVVVLDVMLPDADGFAVLQRLRRQDDAVAVLFLSARTDVTDRVAGITAGGDDYVTKPFDVTEVLARARGLLRRSGRASADATVLRVGDLCLDEDAREVTRGGEVVALSATEFALLRYLVHHPRTVLSKAQLLEAVWHYDFGGNAHVVELYISYLRRKIDAGREPMIHTVRGAGYVLRPAP